LTDLDTAIKHALEIAEICTSAECAEEHRQLAQWLTMLRDKEMTMTDEKTVNIKYNCPDCPMIWEGSNDDLCAICKRAKYGWMAPYQQIHYVPYTPPLVPYTPPLAPYTPVVDPVYPWWTPVTYNGYTACGTISPSTCGGPIGPAMSSGCGTIQ
jgi:hypothetical protein